MDKDASDTVVAEQRYYPYGETRFTSGTIYTDKLFTRRVDWRSRVETGQRELLHQIPQHRMEDAAIAVVVHFHLGV